MHGMQLYNEFPNTVRELLESPAMIDGEPVVAKAGTASITSLKSFKLVQECPLMGE